jgi:ABC-type multidrug transport system fused ATPase/permease subunit
MAKRHKAKQEELMLIPFLDILCSLIGVLCLIIVALSVAQTMRAKGITVKQFELAEKHQKLRKEEKTLEQQEHELSKELGKIVKEKNEIEAREKEEQELKKVLENSKEISVKNQEEQEKLRRMIEDLKAEIQEARKNSQPLQDEIKRLQETLEARQKGQDEKKSPKLVIKPMGSGLVGNFFFAEAFPNELILHLGPTETKKVSIANIAENPDYKSFVGQIKNVQGAILVFLIRQGGQRSYNSAGGVAETLFKVNTTKLPMPPGGEVDISAFGKK